MIIKEPKPYYPRRRRGPSCMLVLIVIVGIGFSFFVMFNRDAALDYIIPTPTPEPTRSATEFAILAQLSEDDGEFNEAIDFYEQAISLDATNPEIFIRLINLYVRQGRPEEALEKSELATVLAPDNENIWTAAAAAYIANGDRLLDIGDDTSANIQYAEAVRAAEQALAINPENATASAYAAGGLILQGNPRLYDRAAELADVATFIAPDNPTARYYMGTVFTYQGQYALAREQFQLGIQSDGSDPNLYYALGYNSFGQGQVADAIISFEQALDIDSEFAPAYDGLAHMYIQLGDDALAIENAQRSVDLNPNVARAWGRLGEAYFRQSNYIQAVTALEEAIEIYETADPINARFFNMLARAYVFDSLENCPRAIPHFESVLEVSTNELLVDAALLGLTDCRRASLESGS